ncbi:MAG: DUF2269 domain-containing protein [Candidatus Manganitrophaceae bacterium]
MYLLLKVTHVISATVLFGVGVGSAFYKFRADSQDDLHAIVFANRNVVLGDWIFITPSVIIQPITGVWMAILTGYRLTEAWIIGAVGLYFLAGLCWIAAVILQIRMRDLSVCALQQGVSLPSNYYRLARAWFWLGVFGFLAMVVILFLMVFKPTI